MIELDPNEASAKGRPLAIHLAAASLRVLEDYRAIIGTVDAIGVVAAVAAGDAPDPDGRDATSRGCSIATIASLCRSDKETTRRWVLRLVAEGILRRNGDRRILLNEPFFREPAFVEAMRRQAGAAARLANAFGERGVLGHCGADGALRLEPSRIWPEPAVPDAARAMLASIHRSLDGYREVVGSTDRVLVVLAVLVITAEHLTRSALPDGLDDARTAMPRDRLAPCNISSIAAAAGLPLETARRKTLELVERGSLVRDDVGNVQFVPGVLQQPMIYDLVARNAAEAVALANRLLQLGVLVAPPASR